MVIVCTPWYDVMRMTLYLCALPSKTHNPTLIMRKARTNQNWGIFCKISDQYSSKLSRSSQTRKVWEIVTAKRRLRRQMPKPNMGSWNKQGHHIKAKGIWIKYRIYLIIIYLYWHINFFKCTILIINMRDVINRRNWAWDIWEISYYFWNFSVNLKQFQNKKLI